MCYIGSSKNLKNRIAKHKALLRKNKHENAHLQSAWNKYGEKSFVFEIIEFCLEDMLFSREQFYLNTVLQAQSFQKDGGKLFYSLGYNINPNADTKVPCPSEEYRQRISTTLKQKYESKQINKTHTKKCYQYNRFTGNLIKIWDCINDANRYYHCPDLTTSKIQRCLWKERIVAFDSVWTYEPFEFVYAFPKKSNFGSYYIVQNVKEKSYTFATNKQEIKKLIPKFNIDKPIKENFLYADTFKIIKCAPIITDRKALELLGSREDLFAKTNEEILNVNA